MKLELDKRIPYQNCIFTCFDTECAEPYIGKQGNEWIPFGKRAEE